MFKTGTIGKRFEKIGVENSEENRLQYRKLLFTSDSSYAESISGVILFHETLYQKDEQGTPLIQFLSDRKVIPGIKVDLGTVVLGGTDGETTTQGEPFSICLLNQKSLYLLLISLIKQFKGKGLWKLFKFGLRYCYDSSEAMKINSYCDFLKIIISYNFV